MKQLFVIGLIIGLTNYSISQSRLADNKTFRKTFTESEIKDLQIMFDFFNESICSDNKTKNLNVCYNDFFKKMKEEEQSGDIQLDISFENQLKVYNSLIDSTFNKIWTLGGRCVYTETPMDTFRTVYYNPKGKYLEFLKRTGRNDKVIKQYYESLRKYGDLAPSLIAWLLVSYDYFMIEDIRVKFVVAIHYLTLNDQFKRKEKINKNGG